MKDDFIFDGRYGSDFNLKICDITSNNSTDSSTISKTDFSTFQSSNSYKNYFTGSTSSEFLTTTFQVGHFENCQMQDFDDDLLEAVSRWFCREDGYHRFAFINSLDDTVEYNAKIDMNKIELGTRVIGLEFTVTTDSQIGYTKRKINKTLSADESFIINDTSSKTGSSPIDVIIKCKQAGDLALSYSFNNKERTIQGGDDVINAAIRAVNPNGTEYINRFAAFQTEDMSKELIDQINAYQELYESKRKPYKEIMNGLYDTIDQILYLTSSMMPSPETDDTDANKELAKLTADNLGMIAVQNLRVAGMTTVNNAVKSMADIYMSAGYKVEIASSTYSNQVWNGRFKVTSVDDENDTAINGSDITLLITDDYETFITQKIQKILDKQDMSDEEYDWTKYGLNRLSSFSDAYQSCIDMLIDSGVGDPNHEFYCYRCAIYAKLEYRWKAKHIRFTFVLSWNHKGRYEFI